MRNSIMQRQHCHCETIPPEAEGEAISFVIFWFSNYNLGSISYLEFRI